jgi:hypothetical protein
MPAPALSRILATTAGPALALWFGSLTAMAYSMAAATGTALLITAARRVRGFHGR